MSTSRRSTPLLFAAVFSAFVSRPGAIQEVNIARLGVSPEAELELVPDDHPLPAHNEVMLGANASLPEYGDDEAPEAALVDDDQVLLQVYRTEVSASGADRGAKSASASGAEVEAAASSETFSETALLLSGPISATIIALCFLAGPLVVGGVALVGLLVAVLCFPETVQRYRPKLATREIAVVAGCLAIPVLTTYGMFGGIEGAGHQERATEMWSPSTQTSTQLNRAAAWFAWHPVLMALSIPCLMALGRFVHASEGGQQLDAEARRSLHRMLIIAAFVAMLGGYLCTWLASWERQQFFGFDFGQREWATHRNSPMQRIAHIWLGYGVLGLAFAQAWTGRAKFAAEDGQYPQYDYFGQAVLVLGVLEMLLGVWVWPWAGAMKLCMAALLCVSLHTALVPKEEKRELHSAYGVETNGN